MVFNIGDRVRLKHDNKENPALTVRSEAGGQRFLCISDCGQRMVWATTHELELVESNFDIKQAIREVLLSEEFLAAFAAAWQKTPLVHVDEMKLTIEPITKSAIEAVALRNRFGIGDTVVDQCTGSLAIVKNINESDGECEIQFEENHRYAYRWGSELSLFKKKFLDCKPSSIDANVSLYSSEVKKYERRN